MIEPKHILVTGSDGFIGKKLVHALRIIGHHVEEFDRNIGDITSYNFHYEQLDHVIHLASLIFVPASWKDPKSFYQTNVIGTVNVLELCRRMACRLTYISSYVYGTPQYLPVDEKHPVTPSSPYNHSKLLAEEACLYYHNTFKVPVTIFRPVNVYGPGQNADFLIPKIIRQAIDISVPSIEVMDLKPRRDYLYIDDFIRAIVASLNSDQFDIFNLGSGYSLSVEEVIRTILNAAGIDKAYSARNEPREHEIWDVYADISKIKRQLGWEPATSFQEGIKFCIDDFKTGK